MNASSTSRITKAVLNKALEVSMRPNTEKLKLPIKIKPSKLFLVLGVISLLIVVVFVIGFSDNLKVFVTFNPIALLAFSFLFIGLYMLLYFYRKWTSINHEGLVVGRVFGSDKKVEWEQIEKISVDLFMGEMHLHLPQYEVVKISIFTDGFLELIKALKQYTTVDTKPFIQELKRYKENLKN